MIFATGIVVKKECCLLRDCVILTFALNVLIFAVKLSIKKGHAGNESPQVYSGRKTSFKQIQRHLLLFRREGIEDRLHH